MKLGIKSALAGASSLALAGAILIVGGGVAQAATPPFDPAGNGATAGTISFYDSSGNQITSGSLTTPPAWAQADTWTGRVQSNRGTLFVAVPVKGQDPYSPWPNTAISVAQTFPTASAPGPLANSPKVLAGQIVSWFDSAGASPAGNYVGSATNSDALWQNLYQLRLLDSGGTVGGQDPQTYASATVQVNVAAGTWTQVYPTVAATTTVTTLAANPASPQNSGTTVQFTATVTPSNATGSVQFDDGGTNIGSPVAVSGGTASVSTSSLAVGSHSMHATFIPTGNFGGSVGLLTYQINAAPAQDTTTGLSVNPTSGPAFANVALHSDVTKTSGGAAVGAGAGTVKFFDGGVQIGQAAVTGTGADWSYSNFAAGAHSLTAQFVPANAAIFNGSTSAAVNATYDAPTCTTCVDPQTVDVSVAGGSLSITTPYGPSNPFHLGTMSLDANGTGLSAAADFPKSGDLLTITDTRAGDLPWTAYASSTDFLGSGGSIAATGLAFTGVTPQYIGGNALNAGTKPVTTSDIASFTAGPHQFAAAAHGLGSVYVTGVLRLAAPSSTSAGLYTATVTFTVS